MISATFPHRLFTHRREAVGSRQIRPRQENAKKPSHENTKILVSKSPKLVQRHVLLVLHVYYNVYSKIPWYLKLLFQRENALASF
jgi:hypothetical protein